MHYAMQAMERASANYLKDLDAMSEEQILASPGGSARKAVDFTYEVGYINRRIAARMTKTDGPPAFEGDGWMEAPAELQSKAAIIAYMSESSEVILAAGRAITEEAAVEIVGPDGMSRPLYAWLNFAAFPSGISPVGFAQAGVVQSANIFRTSKSPWPARC